MMMSSISHYYANDLTIRSFIIDIDEHAYKNRYIEHLMVRSID